MELGAIRSQFIQAHLQRALNAADQTVVWKTVCEFRRYFEWFAWSIDETDRDLISDQLRLLEDTCNSSQKQLLIASTRR